MAVRAFGPAAATLFAQIHYWLHKAANGKSHYVVHRNGHKWVAKSRESLADETGLTLKQLDAAASKLRKLGAIVTERHLFENRVTVHYRISQEEELQENGPPGWSDTGPTDLPDAGESSLTQIGKIDLSISGENISIETPNKTNQELASANAAAPFTGVNKESGYGKKNKNTVSDVLAHLYSGPTSTFDPVELETLFRVSYEASYPSLDLAPFNAKELAQLEEFHTRCPAGKADVILEYAVQNWGNFCLEAVTTQGAFKLPEQPTIRILNEYLQSAANLYLAAHKPKPVKSSLPKKPAQSPAPVVEKDPPEPKATLEEIAALMGIDLP